MASFFHFTQGTESRARPQDSSPLLGRFRAVPHRPSIGRRRSSQLGLLAGRLGAEGIDGRGSVHVGYGALIAARLDDASRDDGDENDGDDEDDDDDDDRGQGEGDCLGLPWCAGSRRASRRWVRLWQRWVVDVWIEPRPAAVKRVVARFWSRYGLLVFLPAALAVAWCAIPFPQYPLPYDDDDVVVADSGITTATFAGWASRREAASAQTPGHGAARVRVNFWFFLFVYYGFYNITALIWITKVFNLYRLNWWPESLGFPPTIFLLAVISIAVPIPIYYCPATRFLTAHNTSWVSWTFVIMAIPVVTAFLRLTTSRRHIGRRHSLSETQRIFTSSWWTEDQEVVPSRDPRRRNAAADTLERHLLSDGAEPSSGVSRRQQWLPASFVRFLWLCVALFVGLMAYVLGEAYAEMYLRTLPHNNLETVVYVYGWIVTVHLLDFLTGWVLGIREGERVGSYPLSWVFKLYFMLTYQTYVRALYARLRSPSQFVILQVLSSTTLVVMTPLMMTRTFHWVLSVLGLSRLSYGCYQKLQTRNVFIRFVAENASMSAFLGSVLVLHYGYNQDVYPYFAFDGRDEPYDFDLTFRASAVTWGCELAASVVVRALIRCFFAVDVGLEGKLDLAVWPELLPTCVVVVLHVLQNMLFSIIRLQFRA